MITLEDAKHSYNSFFSEVEQYPEIRFRIDKQFRDCLLAPRLGCQVPRDILPFCGRVLDMTHFVYDKRNENSTLFKAWKCLLNYLCQDKGLTVIRYGVPPTQLRFPLSRAILKGKNITFNKVSILDSSDTDKLEKLIKKAIRITDQSCGYSVFSETSLRMMLTAKDTLCAYSTTIQGGITAILWGVKIQIQQQNRTVPCFYVLFAAREPEYCGQNIYDKMIQAFQPFLFGERDFKCEFLCWKQGKNNPINNKAIVKFTNDLQELSRSESDPYTFEEAEVCSIRLDPKSTTNPPSADVLENALKQYALNAGDLLTFALEYPLLMFKVNWFWNAWNNRTFPKPNDYQTSLQPVLDD